MMTVGDDVHPGCREEAPSPAPTTTERPSSGDNGDGDDAAAVSFPCQEAATHVAMGGTRTSRDRTDSPRTENEAVAVLVHAHNNGDWCTFRRWIHCLRMHPKGHTIRTIHHNPKNHVLIPYLSRAHRQPDGQGWRAKMMANFSNRGVLASYLQLCDQDHCDHWEDHAIETSLLTMITEDQDY